MSCPSIGPKRFWSVQFVLDRSNLFWSGPNHFGQVQIIKISPEKYNLNLTKMIWAQPKCFGPDQNNLDPTKAIWTVQNHFGPIEGQGINSQPKYDTTCSFSYTFSKICKRLLRIIIDACT